MRKQRPDPVDKIEDAGIESLSGGGRCGALSSRVTDGQPGGRICHVMRMQAAQELAQARARDDAIKVEAGAA